MAEANDLLGLWRPEGMHAPGSRLYDVLVFKRDGTGFVERRSTLNAVVPFSIQTEQTAAWGRARVLRTGVFPWSAVLDPSSVATLRYLAHEATYATFRAPCFALEEEAGDRLFRGKALSDHLAAQLEARGLPVGERMRVYLGACYYRDVEVGGQTLGLAVNWDEDLRSWWLRLSPPPLGGKDETDELRRVLQGILECVDGLDGLEWHTEQGGQG